MSATLKVKDKFKSLLQTDTFKLLAMIDLSNWVLDQNNTKEKTVCFVKEIKSSNMLKGSLEKVVLPILNEKLNISMIIDGYPFSIIAGEILQSRMKNFKGRLPKETAS